jgi:hypothetical protein
MASPQVVREILGIAERDGAILSYLIFLPDYLCTHFSTDLSQRDTKSFLNERGFSKHVVLWSNLPTETREDLLVDFPKWYRTRHQHFFSLAEDNWLSRYLLRGGSRINTTSTRVKAPSPISIPSKLSNS